MQGKASRGVQFEGERNEKRVVFRPVTHYPPRFSRFSVLGLRFVAGLDDLFYPKHGLRPDLCCSYTSDLDRMAGHSTRYPP